MTRYKDAGVHIDKGDEASSRAYTHARATFSSRKGLKGIPVENHGGFAGLIDMGEFFLVHAADGVGSKMDIALTMQSYETIGVDLLAMVADDIVCSGAEVVSITNTIDTKKVEPQMIDSLLKGLSQAATAQHIAISGGEIAELPRSVQGSIWNASGFGIVEKDRVINPAHITEGDVIISLRSNVLRSNGFSLVHKIMEDAHGKDWMTVQWRDGNTWGEILLSKSIIYADALLSLLGRYGQERNIEMKGIAHITGGGIPGNLPRILKVSGLGATLTDLYPPHDAVADLIEIGNVDIKEAYSTWNMGNGMLCVVNNSDAETVLSRLQGKGIEATIAGEIIKEHGISLNAFNGKTYTYT